jgi:hypothetical protein
MRSQLLRQCDVQAVGQGGDEDVRFNPRFVLVVDRPDRKIALEILEGYILRTTRFRYVVGSGCDGIRCLVALQKRQAATMLSLESVPPSCLANKCSAVQRKREESPSLMLYLMANARD